MIKGISIISIVLGHAYNTDYFFSNVDEAIRRFFYVYHLAIFFWCSGYLWKQRKPKQFLRGIVKDQYLKTVVFCVASFTLIPIFNWMRVTEYDINAVLRMLLLTARYRPAGCLTGALWFMPFFTLSSITFLMLNYIENDTVKGVACAALGVIGCACVQNGWLRWYYLNDALLMQPIIFFGSLCKKTGRKFCGVTSSSFFQWSWMISGIGIVMINHYSGLQIELTKHEVYGIWGFYPMTILGICFVISLAKVLCSSKCGSVLGFIGQNSFWIMGTHFWVFKCLDGVSGFYELDLNTKLFPISYGDWLHRVFYAVLGVLLPCLFVLIVRIMRSYCLRERKKLD